MGFVALLAFHSHNLDVGVMLSDINNIFMTRQAIAPIRPRGFVGLVALVAVELHRCLFRHDYLYGLIDCFLIRLIVSDIERRISAQLFPDRFISMAEETLLAARLEVFCAVSMTVQAGELFHACAMDSFPLMAFYAEALFGGELMRAVSVALNAFNLLHEYVFRMHP